MIVRRRCADIPPRPYRLFVLAIIQNMSTASKTVNFSRERLTAHRSRVAEIRQRGRRLFDGGATGIQVAAALCEATDAFLIDLFREALSEATPSQEAALQSNAAVIALGGLGRGELAPYSDTDLLFLDGRGATGFAGATASAGAAFSAFAAQVVRDCWDAGLRLGHSVRTFGETLSLARQDAHVATSLVQSRLLWGDEALFRKFRHTFERKVVRGRAPWGGWSRAFVEACVAAREAERREHGSAVSQLQPNVKRSLGGLRDVHLLRWIGFAHYGTADIDALRLLGALKKDDARRLVTAWEFLTRIRIDLHFRADRPQDVLTYEEQLRIAEERGVEPSVGLRPVERFMQTYFRHSTDVANIVQRFTALHRPGSLASRVIHSLFTHRVDGRYRVGWDWIDVLPRAREIVLGSTEQILKLYHTALVNRVVPLPQLTEHIERAVPDLPEELSPDSARLFVEMMGGGRSLGRILRSLYETGLLERIIPQVTHARCLLQFNEYHSYTVDEHTLRTVEAAVQFARDDGPLGRAYRNIHHREILHLALLLHDLGKGLNEDHSEVGRRIARSTAARLNLPEQQREMLVFLVHKHLLMSHLAFRRDIADPEILLQFSREVGSPELLRMLYVLTAADLIAVGPGIWTDWKAELLTELYDRTMLILSGEEIRFREAEHIKQIKEQVCASLLSAESGATNPEFQEWIDGQMNTFSPHYLSGIPPVRIAADLKLMRRLEPGGVLVEGRFDPETDTVRYHLIAHADVSQGCFHKTTGVLTAKRLEILTAQICTTREGVVVDHFRVLDKDYTGAPPPSRIDDVARTIKSVLTGEFAVEQLFRKHTRFEAADALHPISDLPTRVVIDNDSSDRSTVIDVFAHDRPGLLYLLTRTIYDLGLSVLLAKIGTHLDQVVDVFYVTDAQGRKIEDGQRLQQIRTELTSKVEQFEQQGRMLSAP